MRKVAGTNYTESFVASKRKTKVIAKGIACWAGYYCENISCVYPIELK